MARKKDANSNGNSQQQYIEGTAPPRIPEIDELAMEYRDVRDKRMQLSEQEESLQKELGELLKKHELRSYRISDTDPPLVAKLVVVEEKAKVLKWDPKRDGDKEPPPAAAAEETATLSEEEREELNEAIDQVADGVAS